MSRSVRYAVNTAASDPLSTIADSAVVSFQSGASVAQGLTSSAGAITTAVDGLTPGGATNYQAAVTTAQAALVASTQPNRIVVFLSDGQPTDRQFDGGCELRTPTPLFGFCRRKSGRRLVQRAGRPGVLNTVAAKGSTGCGYQQVSNRHNSAISSRRRLVEPELCPNLS